MLSFLYRLDYCKFDTDVKMFHHDGEQVHTKTQSKNKDLVIFILFQEMNNSNLFDKIFTQNRSSHQMCSIKKGVLRNLTKFTGNQMCQSLFFNKVAGL